MHQVASIDQYTINYIHHKRKRGGLSLTRALDLYASIATIHIIIFTIVGYKVKCSRRPSVVHLSSLVVNILWFGILDIVVSFSIRHRLVQICLVLSLLHVKREVLVVAIHVGGVGVRDDLIDGDRALDGLVLLVEHLRNVALELVTLRLHVLDREADDCAADLHCHGVLRLQPQLLLQ